MEWKASHTNVPYQEALSFMEQRVNDIAAKRQEPCIYLLEHPPLYTAGTSADPRDLVKPNALPVFQTGRGGQYTYHGPGQRIAYVMLDLHAYKTDVRWFVSHLEEWILQTLLKFDIHACRAPGQVGIWVPRKNEPFKRDKIAAIGIRLRKWISFHGLSINVAPNLAHYENIVPCGIKEHGVTSFKELGIEIDMPQLDAALKETFPTVFQAHTV